MAVGTYKLPICDGCKLPWLPVGWAQDSDPRNPEKPLRCGKCKSIGWDREFVKAEKNGDVAQIGRAHAASDAPDIMPSVAAQVGEVAGSTPAVSTKITTIHTDVATGIPTMVETVEEMSIEEAKRRYPGTKITRCKHRMTDCPICHPKEVA